MRKHGLKVLGLALMAAMGLMAFSATAALAVSLNLGDEFYSGEAATGLVNSGTQFPTGLTTEAAKGTQIGSGKFLIPGKSVEIVCAKGELTSASGGNEYENFKTGTMNKGGYGKGTAVSKECKTEEINPSTGALTGKTLVNCAPNPATTPGEVTAQGLGLLKKHEGVTYGILVPSVSSKAQAEANEALTAISRTLNSVNSVRCRPLSTLPDLLGKRPRPRMRLNRHSRSTHSAPLVKQFRRYSGRNLNLGQMKPLFRVQGKLN